MRSLLVGRSVGGRGDDVRLQRDAHAVVMALTGVLHGIVRASDAATFDGGAAALTAGRLVWCQARWAWAGAPPSGR